MITDKAARALRVLLDYEETHGLGIYPSMFADLMWPDSPYHNVHYNSGRGSVKGRGLVMSAGSYLAKLHRRGLTRRKWIGSQHFDTLSIEGRQALAEWEEAHAVTE
jgi:hypothetical protein